MMSGAMLHQLTVLLPGFDDGQWQDVSTVSDRGLCVRLEHSEFTDITLCSVMYQHDMGVAEVLQQFENYVQHLRARADFARGI